MAREWTQNLKVGRVEDRAALEDRDDMIYLSPTQELFAHLALPAESRARICRLSLPHRADARSGRLRLATIYPFAL